MKIEKVRVKGFRLLEDVEIMFEQISTLIVGRNNSGKTSLTDVFDRFISEGGPPFRLQDFSESLRKKFISAYELRKNGGSPENVLEELPKITLTLTVQYDIDAKDLGPLSPFIIDLDVKSTTAIVHIEYAPTLSTINTLLDHPAPENGKDLGHHLFKCIREVLQKTYTKYVIAIDPTDPQNQRSFDTTIYLTNLIQSNLIRAQRTLDHMKSGDPDVIGKLLSTIFKTATSLTAAESDQKLTAQIKSSVEGVEREVQGGFDEMLKGLLPALEVFGFPSLNDTELRPETSLNVEALLSDHTKIVYTGADGVHLPEGYNGLGTRNLIYMLLQLESYHKLYRAKSTRPAIHLIFIEEPEAHLHPQMQEVFISQLNAAVGKLSAKYPGEPEWNVQFIISTHSSHIANAAPFDAIRYFLNEQSIKGGAKRTKVKDFKKGTATIPAEDKEFLHQYMTLTKCDLYFADKAILVEGTTERILMPRLCEIVDKKNKLNLISQYVTVVEVGGAYAHLFYPLIDFLELKTLIITDLDSVYSVTEKNKKGVDVIKWKKCPVSSGEKTSNAAIKEWFKPKNGEANADLKLKDILAKVSADKIDGSRRIAFQIPEEENSKFCARSYEDALILANPEQFTWTKDADIDIEAWEIAQDLPKADTALDFAINKKDWNVPRYISEGLIWLSTDANNNNDEPDGKTVVKTSASSTQAIAEA